MSLDPRTAYRHSAGQTASPIHLVVLLYEQLVEDVRRALRAIQHGNAEACSLEVGHAIEVVCQLQGRLDMEHGGEVARNLDRFYGLLRSGLLQAQIRASADTLRKQLENLLTLREAWLEVERVESDAVTGGGPASAPAPDAGEKKLNWSA